MKYSEEKEQYIIEQYLKGRTQKDIGIEFNTSNTSIRRVLLRNNITILGNDQIQTIVKHNPFINLSDDETLYWLGYLIADGNISLKRNRINISTNKDPDHLKKYIAFLNSPVKLTSYFNKKYGCYEYSVNFANKEVKNYLISLGITPNKSLNVKLSFDISYALLRGLIDGDGYIRKYTETYSTIELASASIDLITQIKDFLLKDGIIPSLKTRYVPNQNPLYLLSVSKKKYIPLLVHNLYNNASVFLERKKQNIGSALWKHNV
jgi:hypothetical protein